MDHSIQIITKSAQETADLGQKIGASLSRTTNREQAGIYCLFGELGSGKTTFAQGFALGLGLTSRLLSPTFIIVRRYSIERKFIYFYHIDLYRISSPNELEGLGLTEILSDPKSVVVIEWAEKLADTLPKNRVDVSFKVHENGDHRVNVAQYG